MKSAWAAIFVAILATICPAQRNRVFSFNSTQRLFGNLAAAQKKRPTSIGYQVSVIGNFGGTFTVHGIGSSATGRQDEFINIITNEPLTFQATNFTTLMSGLASANSAGSITYEMQLYDGNSSSVGASITSPVSGTDTGFNGAQSVLNMASVPGNGQVVLRLSRTLNLTQFAEGATTYTASGTIVLTIN